MLVSTMATTTATPLPSFFTCVVGWASDAGDLRTSYWRLGFQSRVHAITGSMFCCAIHTILLRFLLVFSILEIVVADAAIVVVVVGRVRG